MKKTIFSFDKFEKSFNNIEKEAEVTPLDESGINIIGVIDDYIDCMGSFINSLDENMIQAAIDLLDDDNQWKIGDMNRRETAIQILSNIKNKIKPTQDDLF